MCHFPGERAQLHTEVSKIAARKLTVVQGSLIYPSDFPDSVKYIELLRFSLTFQKLATLEVRYGPNC